MEGECRLTEDDPDSDVYCPCGCSTQVSIQERPITGKPAMFLFVACRCCGAGLPLVTRRDDTSCWLYAEV